MADDDKGAKPGNVSADHPPAASDKGQLTEWTASDRRGPLDAAGEPEVERLVPAHEMDAEGGVDPVMAGHESHDHVAETSETLPTHHGEDFREGSSRDDARPYEASHDSALSKPEHDAFHIGGQSTTAATPELHQPVGDPSAQKERGRSLLPVAAGLVVGALIGAGSAWLVYSQSGEAGAQQQIAALSSRVDAVDKRPDPRPEVTKLQSGLSDLQSKMAAVEQQITGSSKVAATADDQDASPRSPAAGSSKPQQQTAAAQQPSAATPSPADAGTAGKIAGLQAALDEVRTRTAALQAQDSSKSGAADKIEALQGNLSGAQKQAADAQKQAAAAQSALDAVKGEQKQLGDKLAGLTIAVAGALKKADGAEKQAAGAQSGVDSVQTKQKALEGKLGSPALAVVTDSLVQQIDAGQPYTRQVDALASLKADAAKISVLRENASNGVSSAQTLLAKWKPLADPVIASGNNAPVNANFGQRLEHGLFGLVSVRRNDGATGDDLTSRVNLIEADLSHGDVMGAYAVWQKLPDAAKAKSQDWGALAKTSVEALGAARDLQHSAIDALGANKS